MRKWHLISLAGMVLLSIVLLAAAWEFALEDRILSLVSPEGRLESASEHWRYVIIVGGFAALSLVVPLWVSSRAIANRRESEDRMTASLGRFPAGLKEAVEGMNDGFAVFDAEDRFVFCNKRYREILDGIEDILEPGLQFRDLCRATVDRGIIADIEGNVDEWVDSRVQAHLLAEGIHEQRFNDGRWIRAIERRTSDGGIVCIRSDITEHKVAELARQVSEQSLQGIMENVADCIVTIAEDGQIETVNPAGERLFGYEPGELVGRNVATLMTGRDRNHHDEYVRQYIGTGKGKILGIGPREVTGRRKDGSIFDLELAVGETWLGERRIFVGSLRDITKRKEVERALKDSEERYRTQYTLAPVMMHSIDMDGRLLSVTDQWLRTLGYERDEVLGRGATEFLIAKDRKRAFDEVLPFLFETGAAIDVPYQFVRKNGELVDILLSAIMQRDANGENEHTLSVLIDVTEQKLAEEQLRQAQKMEAVGQLSGGIAHDFNNLLTVVQGNLELLSEELTGQDKARSMVDVALRAAGRGGELTHRLLAFSRKQTLRPEGLKLDDLISDMTVLLQRTLGETIEIESMIADDLWHALADPGQVEAAVLNLALNARDAMPNGGKLTIETANVRFDDEYAQAQADIARGDYVQVSVSDTGTGVTAEVLEHVFEPFYTTKEVGEGSGLGLSMVYGFAKQSGGQVTIYSEEGLGTTVRLYLPRAEHESQRSEPDAAPNEPKAEEETILVVEDDPDVRTLAVTLLGDLGYVVLEAGDGAAAIAEMKRQSHIDLLFTDVVLAGGMSGPELAEEAVRLHPELKILFTSGYPSKAIIRRREMAQAVELLNKPFRKAELAQKVREVLQQSQELLSRDA